MQISKLKEKTKSQEKCLNRIESDRRNQLNIMKNTHDQSSSEKTKIINLFESIARDQESELEQLRQLAQSHGMSYI